MAVTPILGIPEIAPTQLDKTTTMNDAILAIENATQNQTLISFSGGPITLSATQFNGAVAFVVSGLTANGQQLTIPLQLRIFMVNNTSAHSLVVGGTSGATVTLAATTAGMLQCDGTNTTLLASGGVGPAGPTGPTGPIASIVAGAGLNGGTITTSGQTISADWMGGTINSIGAGLTIATVGTNQVLETVEEWQAGTITGIGAGLTVVSNVLSAPAPSSFWNAGSVSAIGPGVTLIAGTLESAPVAGGDVVANTGTVSGIPTGVSVSALLDAALGLNQGAVIYRGASTWTVLNPGTSGQLLQSGGTGANPSWTTPSGGSGTVTNIATGTGLTGGPVTTAGTIGLAAIANNDVLANTSGSSNPPVATTLTALIDGAIGNTQGDVLYRSGTAWAVLAPGTSGQVLQTGGASANPSWVTPSGGGGTWSAGTVTALGADLAITSGTLNLAAIGGDTILGNATGGPTIPSAITAPQVLDMVGSAQGNVLYRGAIGWTVLAPGAAGTILQSGGGSGAPSWVSSLNGVTIGQTTPEPGGFTTLTASGPLKFTGSTFSIFQPTSGSEFIRFNDAGATLSSYFNFSYGAGTNSLILSPGGSPANFILSGSGGGVLTLQGANVTSGNINNAPIGQTTPEPGGFTTLTSTAGTISNAVINTAALDTPLDLNLLSGVLDSRITFTRASIGTYFDATGTLQVAASGAPRFDHVPAIVDSASALYVHNPLGLLIEASATNAIRNSTMQGAGAGTLPTNWSQASSTGLAATIIGTGTEAGIAYLDVQFSGTPTAGLCNIWFETATGITAATAQTWTLSYYARLTAGSATNFTGIVPTFFEYTSGGVFVTGGNSGSAAVPGSAGLATQRTQGPRTLSGGATVGCLQVGVQFVFPGGAVSFTIRIGAPQAEQATLASSFIPTTSAAVTRSADVVTMLLTGWYTAGSVGSIDADFQVPYATVPTGINPVVAEINDGTTNNLVQLRNSSGGTVVESTVFVSGSNTAAVFSTNSINANAINKFAASFGSGSLSLCFNGGTVATGAISSFPSGLTTLQLGGGRSNPLGGYLRRFRYWNRAITSTELVQLTAAATPALVNTQIDNSPFGMSQPAAAAVTTLNVSGQLTANGSPGASGQVLASAGPGASPSWATLGKGLHFNAGTITAPTYTLGLFSGAGALASSQVLLVHQFGESVSLPSALGATSTGATSHAGSIVNTTSAVAIALAKCPSASDPTNNSNFTQFGTITMGAASHLGTITTGGTATPFAAGDFLKATAPATVDSTLAGFFATIIGDRS